MVQEKAERSKERLRTTAMSGKQITSIDFSENTESTSDQYSGAASIKINPHNATSAFAS